MSSAKTDPEKKLKYAEESTQNETEKDSDVLETLNKSAQFFRDSMSSKPALDSLPYTTTVVQQNGSNAILRSARRDPCIGYFTMDNWWGQAVGLCLVEKGDVNQCIFDHAHALKVGKTVPLTLKSHPGISVCRQRYHWIPGDQKQTRGYIYEFIET